jgi:hypothetical protein
MRVNLRSSDPSDRGLRARKVLVGIAIGLGVLAVLVLFTPLGGLAMVLLDGWFGGEVKSRQTYQGVVLSAKNGGDIAEGSRCALEVRLEDRLFGDMVKLELTCAGRGLYGQQDNLGWIAESSQRDGQVVHALDQWDDDGDPGIEFKLDEGVVTYWEQTGRQLKIPLDGLPAGRQPAEHDPALVPAERDASPGLDAAGAIAHPRPQVSERCAPGVVCWGPRIDKRL